MLTTSSASDVLAENERLRHENEALKSTLVASDLAAPSDWRLTQVEQTIFQILLKSEVVTKQTIIQLLYGSAATASSAKNMDVFIARIRRKTRSAGVKIETIFGVGYRLLDREAWLKAL